MNFDEIWDGVSVPKYQWHFCKRLYQRYSGIILLPGEYEKIVNHIRSGKAKKIPNNFSAKTRKDAVPYIIPVYYFDEFGLEINIKLKVIYNPVAEHLVTSLPRKLQTRQQRYRQRRINRSKKRS